jgi:hypothetical protein
MFIFWIMDIFIKMELIGLRRLRSKKQKGKRTLYSSSPKYSISRKTNWLYRSRNSQLPLFYSLVFFNTESCCCISALSANRYILLFNLDESHRPVSFRASTVSSAVVLYSGYDAFTRVYTQTHTHARTHNASPTYKPLTCVAINNLFPFTLHKLYNSYLYIIYVVK